MWGVFSRKRGEPVAGLPGRPRLQESGRPWLTPGSGPCRRGGDLGPEVETQREKGCSLRKGCPVGGAETQPSPESGLRFVSFFVKGRDSCLS